MYEILHYMTSDGHDLYVHWMSRLRDTTARIAIDRRVDVGAGYRVYYAIAGKEIVLLLCGGDKRTQEADMARACEYWQDWQRRTDDEA